MSRPLRVLVVALTDLAPLRDVVEAIDRLGHTPIVYAPLDPRDPGVRSLGAAVQDGAPSDADADVVHALDSAGAMVAAATMPATPVAISPPLANLEEGYDAAIPMSVKPADIVEAVAAVTRDRLAALREDLETRRNEIDAWSRRLGRRESVIRRKEIAYARTKVVPGGEDHLFELEARVWELEYRLGKIETSQAYRLLRRLVRAADAVAPWGTRRRRILVTPGRAIRMAKRRGFLRTLGEVVRVSRWIPKLFQPAFPAVGLSPSEMYAAWERRVHLPRRKLRSMPREAASLTYRPLLSVIMPAYNSDPELLDRVINSIRSQPYDRWELCVVDDASPRREGAERLEAWALRDPRIKVRLLPSNLGISGASNAALKMAEGEFVVLVDHDDELKPDAFFEVVKLLDQDPSLDYIYSDEDKVDPSGEFIDFFLKPDWSPDLLLSMNYVSHLSVIRTSLVREVGGFRSAYDGSQDYDLTLRTTEVSDRIGHVPLPLYSWRSVPGSAAAGDEEKPWAYEAARRALEDAMRRRRVSATVEHGPFLGAYRVRYEVSGEPSVLVVVDPGCGGASLRECLASIERSSWASRSLVVADTREARAAALNAAVSRESRGDVLVFVHADTIVVEPTWLEALIEHACRAEVGVVGSRVAFPDGSIETEGLVLGIPLEDQVGREAPFFLGRVVRNVSAVPGTCLAIRRGTFNELGGFATDVPETVLDVDLCARVTSQGLRVIYTPDASVVHNRDSRSWKPSREHLRDFDARWGRAADPYLHPAMSFEGPLLRQTRGVGAEARP